MSRIFAANNEMFVEFHSYKKIAELNHPVYICILGSKWWVLWLGFHQENVSKDSSSATNKQKTNPPKKKSQGICISVIPALQW